MGRVLVFLVMVGVAVYALADCASSDEHERGGVPKGLWFVLIIVLPVFGPVAWIVTKRAQAAKVGGSGHPTSRPGAGRGPQRSRGPVAPDDDPDFLWRLEQDRLRRERENGRGPADGDAGDDEDVPGTSTGS